ARFQNPKAELRPGMFSTARVLLPGGESAIFIPRSAVLRDKTTDSYQVFIVENNAARLRVVVTGDIDGDQIRITNGLTGTETLATNHLSELYDGAPVTTTRAAISPRPLLPLQPEGHDTLKYVVLESSGSEAPTTSGARFAVLSSLRNLSVS